MRRYILLSLLLCLKWTAWGQATYDYRYWFDADDKTQRTGTAAADNWHIDADVSDLTYTYHSIHLQVKDTAGVWSAPVTRHFIKQPDPKAMKGYYWLNDNVKERTEIPVSADEFQIDVSDLDNKMHYIHYLSYDDDWNVSVPQTSYFLKSIVEREDATFYYWTDNNSNDVKSGKCTGEVMMLDMSGEEDGFHVLHLVGGMDGEFSQPMTRMFIKVPQTEGVGSLTCLCYVDGKIYKQESVPSTGGIVDWNLNVGLLSNGFHSIQVQVVTPTGAATSVHESFFFRTTMAGELGQMKLVYNVDGGEYKSQAGDFGTGAFHFDIDVAELKDGLHRLNYMLMSETGTSTKMNSSFFVKTPLGGPGVASYKYWINDNEEEAVKVTLEKRQELFKLISLLPVKAQPIRSSCFHFEVEEDGTPMMYAKNDFHIQFIDIKNYHLDAARQYIDYNVGQAVEEFTELESGKRVYKAKPRENEVIWFKVEAERGDSLALKTDLASNINIFNAKGDTLYNASGPNSVAYGGCHVEETGTYYVALHDVAAKSGDNIALDYFKIDRYAVLSYTPDEVGVLGKTVFGIKLNGNGYDKLTDACLCMNTDTLKADTVLLDSKADMILKFVADEGVSFGEYDIVLEFEDDGEQETFVVEQAISLAEGIWQEPTVKVTSRRVIAVPYPVTVSVTNNSNVSMMAVPLNIAWETSDKLGDVEFMNFSIPLDSTESAEGYAPIVLTDNFLGKNKKAVVMNTFIPLLLPGETIEYILGFNAERDARFNMYAWTGKAFNHPSPTYDAETNIPSVTDYYIDLLYEYETEELLSRTRYTSTRNVVLNTARDHMQGMVIDRALGYMGSTGKLIGSGMQGANVGQTYISLGNLIGGIHLGLMGKIEAANREAYGDLYTEYQRDFRLHAPTDYFDSGVLGFLARFSERELENTQNPEPSPEEHSIYIYTPADPNDILGYTSESGSKHIKEGLTDVDYTIRFENDPELATAAAHTIVVTDTIDGDVHDLSSFTPTSIKIGNIVTELNGEKEFVTTIDMRPRINVIAQVTCDYSSKTGIAKWTIESLDPMTMEPTEDAMDGVLPINSDGNGEGELAYDIKLKAGMADGTEIVNKASIVFDFEDAIQTPAWINIIDNTAPSSKVIDVVALSDSMVNIQIESYDSLSGPWRYDVYSMAGNQETWEKVASEVAVDSILQLEVEEDAMYSYCVIMTDSAGNVEQKELKAEYTFSTFKLGDANSDGAVDAADVVLTISKYLGNDVLINAMAADVNRDGVIDAQDIVGIQQIFLESETQARTNGIKIRQRLWQKQ